MAEFEIFESLPSTQDMSLARLRAGKFGPGWVMAREQTNGIGQHGKSWVGTKGNFMASRWEVMKIDIRSVPQLSFVTALAVYEMLRPVVPDTDPFMRIKWPNDILHRGRKLCGILVQTEPCSEPDHIGVVIGIGMNIRVAPVLESYPTVALRDISPDAKPPEPEALLHKLNGHLDGVLDLWRSKDFNAIAKAWLKRAYGVNRIVTVNSDDGQGPFSGQIVGLDPYGALEVKTSDGRIHAVTGGVMTYGDIRNASGH
ncbi:MAG: biotin--[acetyl-CoA-carboxylase] ligase [Asticcacaulis sp.]